jgi:hypothetical protein
MIIAQPAGPPDVAARPRLGVRPDGNAADQRYLEEAAGALGPIMAACEAGAVRSPRPDVRILVREARGVHAAPLSAIAEILHAQGRPGPSYVRTGEVADLARLAGAALDRALVERLTAHAHASIAAARTELVVGVSPSVRRLAERAIHAEDRLIAALARISCETAHPSGRGE